MGMFAAMKIGRDRCLRARGVSLRRRPRGIALATVAVGLLAAAPAYAQETQNEDPVSTESAPAAESSAPMETSSAGAESAEPTTTSTSSEVAGLYAQAARTYYKNGQYAEAIQEFRKAYAVVPNATYAYNIGRCHERLSQYKEAIEWYERYIAKTADPKDRAEVIEKVQVLRAKSGVGANDPETTFRARIKAGRSKYDAGDYESAIEEFRAAFDIKASGAPLYNIAKSYENMGRWEEAADYYQQYLDIDPDASDRTKVETLIKEMQRRIKDRFKELSISSDPPGADIFIDDRNTGLQGQTNFRLKLEPGPHTLYLDLNGYEPVKRDFVMPDENLALEFKMKKLENVGYLVISVSEEGARIFIDGAIVGLSPFTQKKALEAGVHQVQVEKVGYDRWTGEVEILKDQEVPLEVVLEEYDPPISDETLSAWGSGLVLTGLIGGGIGFFTPFVIQKGFVRRPYFDQLGPESLDGSPFYRQGAANEDPGLRENGELETMELIQTVSLIAGGALVVGGSIFYMVKWFREVPPAPVTADIDGDDGPIVTFDSVGIVPTADGAAVGLTGRF
ncbi:MAG: PEGA domain-containing protein [Myxococcota bacterium]